MFSKFLLTILLLFFNCCFISFSQTTQIPAPNIKHYYTDSLQIESSRNATTYEANTLSDSALSVRGANDMRQLTTILPGLFMGDYGSRTSGGIYYRGLGNRYNGGGVAVYVDDVPLLPGLETSLNLVDISSIILGQQTGYSAGLNELHLSGQNVFQTETNILLSYGNANTSRIQIEHNNVWGDLHYGIVLGGNYTDGFETNVYTGKPADNKKDYSAALKLDWQISNAIHSKTKFTYSYLKENSFPYRLYAEEVLDDVSFNDENSYRNNLFMASENLHFKLANDLTLTSITSYTYFDDIMQLDQDFSSDDIFTLRQEQNRHQITEELRLSYIKPNQYEHTFGASFIKQINSPLSAEVLFKRNGIEELIENNVTANMPETITYRILDSNFFIPNSFEDNKTEFGLYYGASYENVLFDRLSVLGMLRGNYNRAVLDYDVTSALTQYYSMSRFGMTLFDTVGANYVAQGSSSKDYFNLTPKLLLTYSFDEGKQKVFGSFKYGVKNGGYNVQMLSDIVQGNLRSEMIARIKNSLHDKLLQAGMSEDAINSMILARIPEFPFYDGNIGDILWYNPEKSFNYELGWQNSCSILQTNIDILATLFYINVKDLQLTQFSPNGFGRMLTNAGAATSKGIETAIKLQPTTNLNFNIIYNFADARFTKYSDTIRNIGNEYELVDYGNNRIPYTPNHTLNVSGTYSYEISNINGANLKLFTFLEYSAAGGIFWNEANTIKQDYYDLWNAKIGVNYKNWTLELWAKNILNEKYRTFYFESLAKDFYQMSKPAQFGINLKYSIMD